MQEQLDNITGFARKSYYRMLKTLKPVLRILIIDKGQAVETSKPRSSCSLQFFLWGQTSCS